MSPSLLLLLAIMATGAILCSGANILVYPVAFGFNSRLMNMEKLAITLADSGHKVSILINSRTSYAITTDKVTVVEYPIADEVKLPTSRDLQDRLNQGLDLSFFEFWITEFVFGYCKPLLQQPKLLEWLKQQNYDLMFLDLSDACAPVIGGYLDVPTLLYNNHGFGAQLDVFYPAPPSFVPFGEDGETYIDRMTFPQRIENFMKIGVMCGILSHYFVWRFNNLCYQYNISSSISATDVLKRSVVIAPVTFALDYPRPIMPHVVLIPDLFLQEPQPLSSDWEDIMKTSSKEGIIVMSVGTFLTLGEEYTDEIFSKVFARLSHTVIWKYSGPQPKYLGENVKIFKWLPQNDLLAHPKVKLFITHCGMSSTLEAAQHAVPVVAIPFLFDQYRNAAFLVNKAQMGVKLNSKSLTDDAFYDAILHVLGNNTYKENAIKTRALLKDNPVPAKELFLFWVNYVIRHKGAKHLISEAAHQLNLIQYHSIDVILFLVALALLILLVVFSIMYFFLKCISRLWYHLILRKQD